MTVPDRWPRRTRMVGGPYDGQDKVLALPATFPDPSHSCLCLAGGPWEHYIREGDGTYLYDGPCSTDNHEPGDLPHDHDGCCCGRAGCDGSGPWPGDGGQP